MADTENKVRPDEEPLQSEAQTGEFDKDVNISAIVWSGIILAGVTALSFLLMWWMYEGFRSLKEAQDPRPLPIQEAAEPIEPPGPQLQSAPEEDLRTMREQEDALLNGYSLVEGEEGYARVPVDEALDLALELQLYGAAEGGAAAEPDSGAGMSPREGSVEGLGTTSPSDPDGGRTPGPPSHSAEPTKESMSHR